MTRDEILNMQAGRELDALVAEKVMGLSKKPCSRIGGCLKILCVSETVCKCDSDRYMPDPYSTDISAAWEVVEELFILGFTLNIHRFHDGTYSVEIFSIRKGRLFEIAYYQTAPETICKSALIALMEVNHEQ